jgi:hypothetical protein
MTNAVITNPRSKTDKLFWIKFNPTEWLGMYPQLSYAEYGLFHHVIAKLWATPGNRLPQDLLLSALRLKPGSKDAKLLDGLIGYALMVDDAGQIFIPAIDEAYADAIKRSKDGKNAAEARHKKEPEQAKDSPEVATSADPEDF